MDLWYQELCMIGPLGEIDIYKVKSFHLTVTIYLNYCFLFIISSHKPIQSKQIKERQMRPF